MVPYLWEEWGRVSFLRRPFHSMHIPRATFNISHSHCFLDHYRNDLPSTVLRTCALPQRYVHVHMPAHTYVGRQGKKAHTQKQIHKTTSEHRKTLPCVYLRWKLSPVSWCTPQIWCNLFPRIKSNLWRGLVSFLWSPFNVSRIQETSLSLSIQMILSLK